MWLLIDRVLFPSFEIAELFTNFSLFNFLELSHIGPSQWNFPAEK
jgi:hypothetical protein